MPSLIYAVLGPALALLGVQLALKIEGEPDLFYQGAFPLTVGLFYLGGATVLNLVFLWYAWKMQDPPDEMFNMQMFGYSVVYLMALFAFLLVDHWLPLLLA